MSESQRCEEQPAECGRHRTLSCRHAARYTLSALALFAALCTFTACRSTPAGPKPLDQLTPQETHGYQVFQAHCALCHSDRTPDDKVGPSLYGVFRKPYLHSGAPANDDRVSATIEHGRNMMPPQPIEPGSPDFTDLLAYLHTL